FDNIPETGSSTLILNLDTDDVIAGKGTHTMSIFRACNTDLAGMYSVTTTYLAHDFLPDFSTHTMEVQIFALSTAHTYRILDFSGGLYSVGPDVAAYGTAGHASLSHIFTVNCGEVSWTNETDPWGPVVADGQNTYDPETGVITISWLCSAYGEAGVSV